MTDRQTPQSARFEGGHPHGGRLWRVLVVTIFLFLFAGFTALVRRLPEVLECHSVSGQADYMLKVRVRDVEAYEAFMSHHLLRSGLVRGVQSSFVLKEIKATTALAVG